MFQSGFLGTDAGFVTDLTLIAEIIFFIAISVGVVAQRRGHFKLHDWIQTPVVVLNLFLIIFIMITSFREQQVAATLPRRPTDPYYVVVAIHALLGLIATGLAIYALLAGHKILPRKIGRLRYWMWATFGFWTAATIAGVATYYIWYIQPPAVVAGQPQATPAVVSGAEGQPEEAAAPATKQVFLQNFAFSPTELTVTAGTEVIWLNQDGAPHNVTYVDGPVASENFFQGETYAATFSEPGTYLIYCTLHGSENGSGMFMTVTVLEEGQEAQAIVEAAPTPNPTPPTPTPAPTVPPPPVELAEPQTPEQQVVGLVSFFDANAPSDSVAVTLNGIAAPQAQTTYEAWLTSSETQTVYPLGPVEPDESGRVFLQMTDPDGQNLLGLYDGFQLTQEPQFDDDPTPGTVVYSGIQAPQALAQIRAITVNDGQAPAAYGLGARRQTEELLRHAREVRSAYEFLSIADAQRHAEHIVNLLEGQEGDFYGDLDGAHGVQNPGDGHGILPYVTQMQEAAVAAAEAPDATNAIQVHSTHVVLATDNAVHWAAQIRDAALQITETGNVGDIGPYVETITQLSQRLLNGSDDNGDGNVAPDEGGIFTAYQHAQYMGAIPVSGP